MSAAGLPGRFDLSFELLRKAINRAKLGIKEKNEAVKRLNKASIL